MPLIVYHRKDRTTDGDPKIVPTDSSLALTPLLGDPSPCEHLPIANRKSTRSTHNPHPIFNFLIYHHF